MLIVDVETTGTDPHLSGLISIGAINWDDPEKWFYGEARPSEGVKIEDRALEVNGFTREQLADLHVDMPTMLLSFFEWVTAQGLPQILAGHNPGFDLKFIQKEVERTGFDPKLMPFPYHTIDLHSIAQVDYFQAKGFWYPDVLSSWKIFEKLGIPSEPRPHYALNGALFEMEAMGRILLKKSLFAEFAPYPVKLEPWR
jgi:DNA polymerase III epsilon subunit-like protein